jgi:PTH1 family peptidyl-tRNA hydrolase
VLKPLTYMNLSGLSVRSALDGLGLCPGDLLVVHDDMDLDLGRTRIRLRGSSGGHRGVQSIIDSLGTGEFARLRIGIGRPPEGVDPVDYVLGSFAPAEEEVVRGAVDDSADAIMEIIAAGYDISMSRHSS